MKYTVSTLKTNNAKNKKKNPVSPIKTLKICLLPDYFHYLSDAIYQDSVNPTVGYKKERTIPLRPRTAHLRHQLGLHTSFP